MTNEETRQAIERLVKLEAAVGAAVLAHPRAVRWRWADQDDPNPRSWHDDVIVYDGDGAVIVCTEAVDWVEMNGEEP